MAKKNPKSPKPNITPSGQSPIEKAIGDRARKVFKPENPPIPQNPSEIPDEPSPSEMLTLEELNRRTEEKLRDDPKEEMTTIPIKTVTGKTVEVPQAAFHPVPTQEQPEVKKEFRPIENYPKATTLPASTPVPQPVTETSSPESPPQKNENAIEELDVLVKKEISDVGGVMKNPSAEDVELTALRKYIQEDGFVLATVAFHIVTLCAEPMTTPSTTTWDFAERAEIPAMVLALLNQPGYLEGIWPSLRIVMSSNKGNAAWTAGIATTIAFFDVIRTLPALEELKNAN